MYGDTELAAALNVPAITGLLDSFSAGLSGKALFDARVLPKTFKGNKSINFYLNSPIGPSEIDIYSYTINCRSDSEKTGTGSQVIAKAVMDEISRESYSGYYIVCSLEVTIPPEDDQDNYNTPITATIKMRS